MTSLVAVFLALGIGIFIGSMVLGQEFIGDQQEALIKRLEDDFQQMRIQNGLTKSELVATYDKIKEYEEVSRYMLPPIIKGKLENYQVVVVQIGSSYNLEQIINPLETAGAKIQGIISLTNEPSFLNDLQAIIGNETIKNHESVSIIGQIILGGDENDFLTELVKKNLVNITDIPSSNPDAVILAGGSQIVCREEIKEWNQALVDYLIENGIKVIVVEPANIEYSCMHYYRNYRAKALTTIDHVDAVSGQLALVYAILGEEGHFGILGTAEALMPVLW